MCDACMVGKVKQKNLPKTMKDQTLKGQIQMDIDIATLKDKKYAQGNEIKFWCLKVLEPCSTKFSNSTRKRVIWWKPQANSCISGRDWGNP